MSAVESFRTRRLVAIRPKFDHLDRWFRILQDPRVAATLGGVRSLAAIHRGFLNQLFHWFQYGFGYWVWARPSSEEFVGLAGLQKVGVGGGPGVELGYSLRPEFWGRGLATEIGGALQRLAFGPLRLTQLISYTLVTNTASRRVLEKLRFSYEREIRHAGLPHAFYRMTAVQYLERF